MKVSIVKTDDGVMKALQNAMDDLGGMGKYVCRDDSVMIKPNLNDTQLVTNKELTESVVVLLREYGLHKIVIAESTFGDANMTDSLISRSGYGELARTLGITMVNMNNSPVVEVSVQNPLVTERLKIAREAFEADKIINLPVMKVHYAAGVTLAMKNLKGVMVGPEKRRFHDIGLHRAIVDLNNTIKPAINIIDCISCMERLGPKGGDIVNLNGLIAGESAAETDFVGCTAMGYSVDEVEYLKLFARMNDIVFQETEIVGEGLAAIQYPFKKVGMGGVIPPVFRMKARDACSTCMVVFLASLETIGALPEKPIDVYLGAGWDQTDSSAGEGIAFGNCAVNCLKKRMAVAGSPPLRSALKKTLEKGITI
jgi:uncharacterized protein (DUF362 family)